MIEIVCWPNGALALGTTLGEALGEALIPLFGYGPWIGLTIAPMAPSSRGESWSSREPVVEGVWVVVGTRKIRLTKRVSGETAKVGQYVPGRSEGRRGRPGFGYGYYYGEPEKPHFEKYVWEVHLKGSSPGWGKEGRREKEAKYATEEEAIAGTVEMVIYALGMQEKTPEQKKHEEERALERRARRVRL